MDELVNETSEAPKPLPPEVMADSKSPSSLNLPLHLRVLELIVEGQPEGERLRQALQLANEIYELETTDVPLDEYRSAS